MTVQEETLKEPDQGLVILVDLDGVLVNFVDGWKKVWNERHPERPITEDPTSFLLEDSYAHIAKAEEVIEIMHTPEFFLRLDPMPGAIEAFKQMQASGLELYLCSAPTSSSSSHSEKIDWVEMHLGKEWIRKTILTKDKTMIHGDYLIDDNPVVTGIFDPSWEHIVFDAPYNRDEEDSRYRISWKNWPALLLHHASK